MNPTFWRSHLGSSSDESEINEHSSPMLLDTDSEQEYAKVYSLFDSPTISKHLLDKKSAYVRVGIVQKQTPIDTLTRNLRKLSIQDKEETEGDDYDNPEDNSEPDAASSTPTKLTSTNISTWIHQAPQIFHGRWDEDVWKFTETFNKHVKSLSISLDSEELLNYFKEYLEGEVLRVVEPLMVLYAEWDTFIVKFTQRFTTHDRKTLAKAEFKKMNIYAEESLFTFSKLLKNFQIMAPTDEATKVVNILKEYTEVDRNRLLDKEVKTVEEIMKFFAKKEEQKRVFDKNNAKDFDTPAHATTSTSMFSIKKKPPGTDSVLNKKVSAVKHKPSRGTETPRTAPTARRSPPKPLHTKITQTRGNLFLHYRDHDTSRYGLTIRTLVSIELQAVPVTNIAAIKGLIKVNGNLVTFQYNIGSSINVLSTELVKKLQLKPLETSSLLITPSHENTHADLFLLGVDFMATIGAEISLKKKEMTVEIGTDLHTVPLILETRVNFNKAEVTTTSQLPEFTERNTVDKFGHSINKELAESYQKATHDLLDKYTDTFAERLEDLRGADLDPCEIELLDLHPIKLKPALTTLFSNPSGKGRLGRWEVKLRNYDFKVRHNEGISNPADFLSRFPLEKLPEELKEEVLFLYFTEFNQLKSETVAELDRLVKKRPLPGDNKIGNKYVLDQEKSQPVAVANKNANASTIIAFMREKIVAQFGVPKLFITDRGTHLSNESCACFNRYLGIKYQPVTAYRPQANCQVERSIKTLNQTMRKLDTDKPESWDFYL
ncbi:Pro-Pol polyprotein [Smittium culicis]|uniref:Pro-Pol polyprotein n=1 Tax=Smittium culicis TaxID=133412 RepID=A0A1R1XX53_9FUNG|nr:Pro-Pol polyprotein [Smittium culicis]OMJ19252.1 Pro-Pol polyprotein [Smittium culicis]